MTETHLAISIPADALTVVALIELLHGLHVQSKHIIRDFDQGILTANTAAARLMDIANTNRSLCNAYITHLDDERAKEPF
tara:strand:+ start:1413 stop:1652 length:240 start_codon:yes stop_codon:yes gene_type:complete